eukprot:752556-Hanusia_phi.AAC.1
MASVPSGNPSCIKTIFHAFNMRINSLHDKLDLLCNTGYDAIQLSPLQKSIHMANAGFECGSEWWARYQPVSHLHIEGLGSAEDLRRLCNSAREKGIIVIADVVFNHMAVVASREEWLKSEKDARHRENLLKRLEERFAPLTRSDFHPWKDCSRDPDWDNENRFEGWGAGEWSDLKPTEKVLDIHKRHLDDLLSAGVRGFRFDAAKHIRPSTLKIYVDHIRARQPDCFVYFEVLSGDPKMHAETMSIAKSTDFLLCWRLRDIILGQNSRMLHDLPELSPYSIRFARNHDTIMNQEMAHSMGYRRDDHRCILAWVIIMAIDTGTVLVFPEDQDFHHQDKQP